MVTSVTLGSFFKTSDGKTVLGGAGGSGLDTQSLIKSLTDAKRIGIVQVEDKIKLNDSKSTALNELQTLLSTFRSSADALRNPPGVNNFADNAFSFTTAEIANGGEEYFSVTTAAGAANQSYNVRDISSIATNANQGSGVFTFASANADATVGAVRFNPGTITFDGGATVTVTAGDSLNAIVANFNAVSAQTGITASIIQIDATNFQLSFVATKTGTEANFDLTDSGTVTSGAAVLADLGLTAANSGTNARFRVNDVLVERQSNIVSDVISNVTFKISQLTPDAVTRYGVTVAPDTIVIQNTIVGFVNAYNAIKEFEAKQVELKDDGTYADTAVLANDSTYQAIISNINREVNSKVAGILTGPTSLSQVGITFTNKPATSTSLAVNNILTINDGQLSAALANDFEGVKDLFGLHVTTTNPNFKIFSKNQPIGVTDFTITKVGSVFTASYTLNGQSVNSTLTATPQGGSIPGFTLRGAAGSALEGSTFIYGSNADATFTVKVTQGIADQVYTSANAALTKTTGTLAVALKSLQDSDKKLNEDIATLNVQLTAYQEQLISQFAALEKAIANTNTLLQSLSANADQQLIAAS